MMIKMGIKFSEGFRNEDHIQNNSNLDGLLNADINKMYYFRKFSHKTITFV